MDLGYNLLSPLSSDQCDRSSTLDSCGQENGAHSPLYSFSRTTILLQDWLLSFPAPGLYKLFQTDMAKRSGVFFPTQAPLPEQELYPRCSRPWGLGFDCSHPNSFIGKGSRTEGARLKKQGLPPYLGLSTGRAGVFVEEGSLNPQSQFQCGGIEVSPKGCGFCGHKIREFWSSVSLRKQTPFGREYGEVYVWRSCHKRWQLWWWAVEKKTGISMILVAVNKMV